MLLIVGAFSKTYWSSKSRLIWSISLSATSTISTNDFSIANAATKSRAQLTIAFRVKTNLLTLHLGTAPIPSIQPLPCEVAKKFQTIFIGNKLLNKLITSAMYLFLNWAVGPSLQMLIRLTVFGRLTNILYRYGTIVCLEWLVLSLANTFEYRWFLCFNAVVNKLI